MIPASAFKRFLGRPRESDDIARAFARCFHSGDGQIVLDYLHQHSLFRLTDPQLPDAHLRFIEGQRQLVLLICQMAAKGALGA